MDATKFTTGNNRYKAAHLDSQDLRLVVSHVDAENLARDGEQIDEKLILYFKGDGMSLPLNITNSKSIVEQYGKDTLEWCNKTVILHPTVCDFGGKQVECIRLKFPPVATAPAAVTPVATAPVDVPTTVQPEAEAVTPF
jgi:hypothetical protein